MAHEQRGGRSAALAVRDRRKPSRGRSVLHAEQDGARETLPAELREQREPQQVHGVGVWSTAR